MMNGMLKLRARAAALALAGALAVAAQAQAAPPATAKALSLAPKAAQVAVALPPLTESLDAYVAHINKVSPQSNIESALEEIVADLARDASAGDADTLAEVALARGLDPAQPIAAFFDFSKSLEPIRAAQKGDDGDESGEEPGEAAETKEKTPDPAPPAWVAVLGVSDKAKAEQLLQELSSKAPGVDPAKAEEVKQGDLTVTVNAPFAHFFTDTHVALGTKDLVLAAAAEHGKNNSVRYGSDDLPAGKHEIVALIYGDRFFPLLDELLPLIEMDDIARGIAAVQVANMKEALKSEGGEDPIVITHSIDNKRADLRIHIDTKTHPGYLAQTGPASPLRLSPLLPEDTLAFLSLRLNEEAKTRLKEQVLPAIQQGGGQGAVYALPAIQMIGDEITLGIAAVENDFPAAYLMIALAEPDAAKGMLNMLVPTMPAETHNEEKINSIAAPIPVPLAMATPGDMLLVSNNMDGMKGIIDLKKSNGKTALFSKLGDPLKEDTKRYQALVLKSQLLTDVVIPLSALGGGLPPNVDPVVQAISTSVDEIRFVSELQDNWAVTQLTTYLK